MINVKKIIFICLLIAWLTPAIQQRYAFINSKGLAGWFPYFPIPEFTWDGWFSGGYQPEMDKGLDSNIGLRGAFVRTNNQLNHSLFNINFAQSIITGKEDCLFEEAYINAFIGNPPADSNKVKLTLAETKYVQDELEKSGCKLLIILAPGKGSFYPEYIPDRYNVSQRKTNYYDLYSHYLKNSGIHYLDFNDYFKKLKSHAPYPLYTKQGTHWSAYGAALAMDSLLRYIKRDLNIDVPQVKIAF